MALARAADDDLTSFGALLRAHLRAMSLSMNKFALSIGADPSYMSRICTGGRGAPSRAYVDAMARRLHLRGRALNEFYARAGYCPPDLGDDWPETHARVAEVLNSLDLSWEDKVEFADVVQTIAKRYRKTG